MRHENGQVTGAQAVEKLLFQDQTSSQAGVIEGKDGGGHGGGGKVLEGGSRDACDGDGGSGTGGIGNATDGESGDRSGGISSSSPMGDRRVKTELKVGDTNAVLKNSEEQEHLQMKRKLDSYQKSWFALQSIHSVMNPTTTMLFKRKRRRYKGEGNESGDIALMMMKCSQELNASYYGSVKIACAPDDKTENHQEDEILMSSSRHTDEEMLKEKLSCVQKELDDAIRLIFPAPMKGRAKKSRFTAAVPKITSHSTDNGCNVNNLKQEI